ncbi:MAG TPA: roadblock/LC7 domain-containing protein [Thermopolyspora sp.]
MAHVSVDVRRFDWLITEFVTTTPGVAHALVVSSDGLRLASSSGFPPDHADQLAAVAAGLVSLTAGASRVFDGGAVTQTVVEMRHGVLLVMSISDGSCLSVLAGPECDMGLIAYNMTVLGERVGRLLTPALRAELQTVRSR